MEILIILAVAVIVGAAVYYNRKPKDFSIKSAVQNAVCGADVNKDGKVNVDDAKAVAKSAATKVKSAANKAKTVAKSGAKKATKKAS